MKSLFCAAAMLLIVPAAASAASHTEAKALPKCSATVRDACDQSTTTEKNAMTAAQAEATGGVGDRGARTVAATPKKRMVRKTASASVTTTTTTP